MLFKALLRARSSVTLSKLFRQRRCMSGYVSQLKEPHMNDIPIPHEPFEVGYKKRQRGNNFVLVAGVTFFAFTFFYVKQSGVIYMNPTPPRVNKD